MTRSEFILRAMISMCANPKMTYTDGSLLSRNIMLREAENLADYSCEYGDITFDSEEEEPQESVHTLISYINDSLYDIKEAMGKPRKGEDLSTLQ